MQHAWQISKAAFGESKKYSDMDTNMERIKARWQDLIKQFFAVFCGSRGSLVGETHPNLAPSIFCGGESYLESFQGPSILAAVATGENLIIE